MFAMLMHKLEAYFVAVENHRRDAYLSAATDLADLERRSRYFEAGHQPFAMSYSDRERNWRE
jgi:hypothetical protein